MVRPPKQMAVVTIGHYEYLLPSTAALRVVEAMAQALKVDVDYVDHKRVYTIQEPANVEYRIVRPGEVRAQPEPPPTRPVRALLDVAPEPTIKGRG